MYGSVPMNVSREFSHCVWVGGGGGAASLLANQHWLIAMNASMQTALPQKMILRGVSPTSRGGRARRNSSTSATVGVNRTKIMLPDPVVGLRQLLRAALPAASAPHSGHRP